jgi:hypothetical protein
LANKITFQNKPAYQEGPFALVKDDSDGLWRVYHIQTGKLCMWIIQPFKQKRDALSYAEALAQSRFDWNVNSDTELVDRNGVEPIYAYLSQIYWGMEKK